MYIIFGFKKKNKITRRRKTIGDDKNKIQMNGIFINFHLWCYVAALNMRQRFSFYIELYMFVIFLANCFCFLDEQTPNNWPWLVSIASRVYHAIQFCHDVYVWCWYFRKCVESKIYTSFPHKHFFRYVIFNIFFFLVTLQQFVTVLLNMLIRDSFFSCSFVRSITCFCCYFAFLRVHTMRRHNKHRY